MLNNFNKIISKEAVKCKIVESELTQSKVDDIFKRKLLCEPKYYLLYFKLGRFTEEGKNVEIELIDDPKEQAALVDSKQLNPVMAEMLKTPRKIFRNFMG